MEKVSVVINTLNEEKNLPRTISSVKKFADEIVVVDMESSDNTKKVARDLGARVFNHEKRGYVEPARNFAVDKANFQWVLVLDADEELSSGLSRRLKSIIKNTKADYYRLPRKNIIFGRWIRHSGWWPDYNIRFFKKGSVSWSEIIHSVPETRGVGLDLEPLEENAIIHNHYQTIEQFVERLNRYTSYQARNIVKEGYKFKWGDLITKPINEFLGRYFQNEGYKDGLHGLALCGLQAFSEFVKYLKIWQVNEFKPSEVKVNEVINILGKQRSDIYYWQSDALLKERGGLKYRIKRKLKLP